MKNIIVLTGHANYASGLLSSLEMIAGKNDDIIAVDFNEKADIVKIYNDIILKHNGDNILFVCDLLGGTPFKEASKIALPLSNCEVVIGCNLGSLLETSLIKDTLSLTNLATSIIASSIKNTILIDREKITNKIEPPVDGI